MYKGRERQEFRTQDEDVIGDLEAAVFWVGGDASLDGLLHRVNFLTHRLEECSLQFATRSYITKRLPDEKVWQKLRSRL